MKLQTRQLSLRIGSRVLLAGLDWQVNAGECWCVIGRNGAGKSTLLRSLAGLRAADQGGIDINGRPLQKWPLMELAKLRGYLPQGRNDAFAYSVIDTVLSARHPYHDAHYWESAKDRAVAHAALAELDVAALAERDVRSLSGGERQRVAIAALLAQDARLMLLDEPANALDMAHQVRVMQLFAQCCQGSDSRPPGAVVMVSHDLNMSWRIATHVLLLMGDGRWQAGPSAQLMNEAALSACLGHPIDMIMHAGQRIYLPSAVPSATAPVMAPAVA